MNDVIEAVEFCGGCLFECSKPFTARVRVGWTKFWELNGILYERKWSVTMKGTEYKACVRAAMVYGSLWW